MDGEVFGVEQPGLRAQRFAVDAEGFQKPQRIVVLQRVGTGQGPLGGGSLVERNLNRWTVGFAIAFGLNTILLIKAPWN